MSDPAPNVQEILTRAVERHEAGKLPEAEALYREILGIAPRHSIALNLLGVVALQVGRPDVAIDLIGQAIEVDPRDGGAHYNLGTAHLGLGQSDAAARHFSEAITLRPDHAAAHYNLGALLLARRDLDAAEQAFRSAIAHAPELAQAWCNLGAVLQEKGDLEAAVVAYRSGLERNHTLSEGHNNLANTLVQLDRLDEALESFKASIRHDPTFATGHRNLATTLYKAGLNEQAGPAFRAALVLAPESTESCYNHGTFRQQEGDTPGARRWFQAALVLSPGYINAAYNLGSSHLGLGEFEEARNVLREVLRRQPEHDEAWGNLGAACQSNGEFNEARDAYKRLLCRQPAHVGALHNLTIVHQGLRHLDQAIDLARRARAIEPLNPKLLGGHAIALQLRGYHDLAEKIFRAASCLAPTEAAHNVNLGLLYQDLGRLLDSVRAYHKAITRDGEDWNTLINLASVLYDLARYDEAMVHDLKAIELAPELASPYHATLFHLHYHPTLDHSEFMRLYRQYDERVARPLLPKNRPHENTPSPDKRLKIGYVGPTFASHSSNRFFEPLLANHDHDRFEIYCYAQYPREEDDVTRRFRGYADHWTTTFALNDEALAERVRADGIDILVDIAGHTKDGRLGVFARKPAPVSLNWLDHALTTGLSAIDYILGDPIYLPPGREDYFIEKPWRLPRTVFPFQPYNIDDPEGASPAAANGFVTFGTLSRSIRMNQRVVDTWARVLRNVPGSRLLMFSKNYQDDRVNDELRERFSALGVDGARITLGYNSTPADVYRQIDIALDCFPHNSGVTLFEHIYMGHPVVTLQGPPAIGKLASVLLHNIGHPEWIAHDEDQFVEIATDLASDIPRLVTFRDSLRSEMVASPIMDGPGFARDFEAACRAMWKDWCEKR